MSCFKAWEGWLEVCEGWFESREACLSIIRSLFFFFFFLRVGLKQNKHTLHCTFLSGHALEPTHGSHSQVSHPFSVIINGDARWGREDERLRDFASISILFAAKARAPLPLHFSISRWKGFKDFHSKDNFFLIEQNLSHQTLSSWRQLSSNTA